MEPTLNAGDLVFVQTGISPVAITEDDIVVAIHPLQDTVTLVKRVAFRDGRDRLFLESDNVEAADASDSRTFGPIEAAAVIGRVTSRLGR